MRITFNKKLLMSKAEIDQLNALPFNNPDTKLTTKQAEFVSELYYKYITPIDNQRWGKALYEIEMEEKWPSGPRMKQIQAKRIILNALEVVNNKCKLKGIELAKFFYSAFDCRESWRHIVRAAFIVKH